MMTSHTSAETVRAAFRHVFVSFADAARVITGEFSRRRELGRRTPILPATEATHRDIVLGGATIQLNDEQLRAVRELQLGTDADTVARTA